jgi:hypothetical protein
LLTPCSEEKRFREGSNLRPTYPISVSPAQFPSRESLNQSKSSRIAPQATFSYSLVPDNRTRLAHTIPYQ